jgi:hypothetical protein
MDQKQILSSSSWIVERSRESATHQRLWRWSDHEALVRNLAAIDQTLQACFASWCLCSGVCILRRVPK